MGCSLPKPRRLLYVASQLGDGILITAQGFGMGALVNFDWKLNKELGMIVRQSKGYFWMVKRLHTGENLLVPERDMEVLSPARPAAS